MENTALPLKEWLVKEIFEFLACEDGSPEFYNELLDVLGLFTMGADWRSIDKNLYSIFCTRLVGVNLSDLDAFFKAWTLKQTSRNRSPISYYAIRSKFYTCRNIGSILYLVKG